MIFRNKFTNNICFLFDTFDTSIWYIIWLDHIDGYWISLEREYIFLQNDHIHKWLNICFVFSLSVSFNVSPIYMNKWHFLFVGTFLFFYLTEKIVILTENIWFLWITAIKIDFELKLNFFYFAEWSEWLLNV